MIFVLFCAVLINVMSDCDIEIKTPIECKSDMWIQSTKYYLLNRVKLYFYPNDSSYIHMSCKYHVKILDK